MNSDELEPEQWQYISVLIAQDIRDDRADGIEVPANKHLEVWEKIQHLCQWDQLELEDE